MGIRKGTELYHAARAIVGGFLLVMGEYPRAYVVDRDRCIRAQLGMLKRAISSGVIRKEELGDFVRWFYETQATKQYCPWTAGAILTPENVRRFRSGKSNVRVDRDQSGSPKRKTNVI